MTTKDYRACGPLRMALYEPDIPQNTGTILRLCACRDVEAHLIEPAGFPTSDRAFRRAGMDYLDQVTLVRHASWPPSRRGGAPKGPGCCCSPREPKGPMSSMGFGVTTCS